LIARVARDSLFVRAFGAINRLINCNCGSRTAVGVLSLACPRESTQREGHPGRGAAPLLFLRRKGAVPCAPRQPRARAELAGAQQIKARARARTSSRDNPRGRLRCSACSTGSNSSKQLEWMHSEFFFLSQPADVPVRATLLFG